MGYAQLKLLGAAVLLGFALAIPAAPASAGAVAPIAVQTEAAAETSVVLVGNKNNWKKAEKNWNKNNKNWNKNYYKNNKVVVVRPYRKWYKRPYYGQWVGGVALGTVLAAGAYAAASGPPAPGLCWYWADPYQSQGYWDYCY